MPWSLLCHKTGSENSCPVMREDVKTTLGWLLRCSQAVPPQKQLMNPPRCALFMGWERIQLHDCGKSPEKEDLRIAGLDRLLQNYLLDSTELKDKSKRRRTTPCRPILRTLPLYYKRGAEVPLGASHSTCAWDIAMWHWCHSWWLTGSAEIKGKPLLPLSQWEQKGPILSQMQVGW